MWRFQGHATGLPSSCVRPCCRGFRLRDADSAPSGVLCTTHHSPLTTHYSHSPLTIHHLTTSEPHSQDEHQHDVMHISIVLVLKNLAGREAVFDANTCLVNARTARPLHIRMHGHEHAAEDLGAMRQLVHFNLV